MGFDWTPIENSFPAFREDESPMETVKKIHDYLYRLINQLKYTLQNLDVENWNAAALQVFSENATKDVSEQARRLVAQMSQLSGSMDSLSGRLLEISNRIAKHENEISYLQNNDSNIEYRVDSVEQDVAQNRNDLESLSEDVVAIALLADEMDSLREKVDGLLSVISCGEESTVIGEEGKPLYLWGEIYINGVLYDGGEQT